MAVTGPDAIVAGLAGIRSDALFETAGALQLVPVNGNHLARLEAFAYFALATERDATGRDVRATKARVIANDLLSPLRHLDDPPENLFVENVGGIAGNYRVFPGQTYQITQTLQIFARMLDPRRGGAHTEAARSFYSMLAISDALAERAGLSRYTRVPSPEDRRIVVPPDDALAALRRVVRFTPTELAVVLRRVRRNVDDVAPLIASDPFEAASYDPHANRVNATPLTRYGDDIIVVSPTSLVNAAVARVVAMFQKADAVDALVSEFAEQAWEEAIASLRSLGFRRLRPYVKTDPSWGLRDGFFQIDADKIAYVVLITDRLQGADPTRPWTENVDPDLEAAIKRRVGEAVSALRETAPTAKILVVALAQGFGRAMSWQIGEFETLKDARVVSLGVADLRTIAATRPGDTLVLWKFAGALDRLYSRTRVRATSSLDTFALYHSRHDSFYMSDDALPDYLTIPPASGAHLRFDALGKQDPHVVSTPDGGLTPVVAQYDAKLPIYRPFPPGNPRSMRCVEIKPRIWILPTAYDDDARDDASETLSECLAFWLARVAGAIQERLPALQTRGLNIRIELQDAEAWKHLYAEGTDVPDALIKAAVSRDRDEITLILEAGAMKRFRVPDNSGERELLSLVLSSIRDLCSDEWPADAIAKTVDDVAPLGLAKKIVIINQSALPLANKEGLPEPRLVPDHEAELLLDDLGEHLRKEKGRTEGRVQSDAVNAVLHETVAYFFARLEALVAELDPHTTNVLVALHEALLAESTLAAVMSDVTSATYEAHIGLPEDPIDKASEHAEAAVSLRFLVEYVAARPPDGKQIPSDTTIDELLALAKHITSYGFDSDIAKYELAQPRLSILPSGRLGRAADLDAPRRAILRTLNRGQLSVAAERLAKSYVERPAAEPAEADQLDAAVKDEFGFTLTQLIHLLVELMNIANDKLSQICVLQRAAVEAEITRRLDWGAEDAARGLRLFTLGPREKFLEPAGYARFEVYPWRYGRRLSYLRRPVIELPTGELLWGRRHVYAAVEYLIATLLDGRMFPQSKRLREYFGAQTEARGAEFEKSVANIAGRKGWLVRTGVKKIPTSTGTLRVPGDIDVLAVDERRRRIYVIECKNLAAARTPAEMQHEIEQLLLGNAKTRPAVTKHVERVGFVKENLNAVVAWLGLDQGKRWTLADAIVVDAPAFSPHLRQLATRILTAKEFEAH